MPAKTYKVPSLFQSTPSARRATQRAGVFTRPFFDFNPRPPRGGRLWGHWKQFMGEVISIHALREEGDELATSIIKSIKTFQSTPSARRATMSKISHTMKS